MPLTVAIAILIILVGGGALVVYQASNGYSEAQMLLVGGMCSASYVFGHWAGSKGSKRS